MRRATRDLCSNLDDSGMCIAQQNEKIRGNIILKNLATYGWN